MPVRLARSNSGSIGPILAIISQILGHREYPFRRILREYFHPYVATKPSAQRGTRIDSNYVRQARTVVRRGEMARPPSSSRMSPHCNFGFFGLLVLDLGLLPISVL